MSIARSTLERARFFVKKAEEIGPDRREELQHYIDAAIVFARSVTFHLQKEYGSILGFDVWYADQQGMLRKDATARFLLEKRNYILKEGPAVLQRQISVSISETLMVSGFVEVKITRGKPWYRRSPKILWQDLRELVMRPVRRWEHNRAVARRRAGSQARTTTEIKDLLVFDESGWSERSAFEVIGAYLDTLAGVVTAAENRFEARGR